MKTRLRATWVVVAAALLAGCGSVAPPRFHTLMAAPAADATDASLAAAPIAWELLPVTIPARIDRPQWVVRAADETLAVLEQERWIAPLPAEMHAAISERLRQKLGAPHASAPVAPHKAWRVRVDVRHLDSLPGKAARLEAEWSVSGDHTSSLHCRSSLEQAAGAGFPALAEALRQAVRRLADAIGAGLVALDAGQPAACR